MKISAGFITGTGFYQLPNLVDVFSEVIQTPYGDVEVQIGSLEAKMIAFIPRHGKEHKIAPAQINYRANIYAFHILGVERILSTSVCGSLVSEWGPGSLVLIDQFLNFSSGRASSYYPLNGILAHVDMTEPYCPSLHSYILQAAQALGIQVHGMATYACFDGPRFETRAEIEMVRKLGGHLVGMTNYPECVLARELEICYATVGIVSNPGAGTDTVLRASDLSKVVEPVTISISRLFKQVLILLPDHQECTCRHALEGATI